MKNRICNHINCKKKADIIIPFNSMGASDAYCKEHYKLRELNKKEETKCH